MERVLTNTANLEFAANSVFTLLFAICLWYLLGTKQANINPVFYLGWKIFVWFLPIDQRQKRTNDHLFANSECVQVT